MVYDVWQTCVLVPGFTRSECASWVQAWGSIAAIGAAILIAWWQRRSEHRAAFERAQARAEIAGTSVLLKMSPIRGALEAAADGLAVLGSEEVRPRVLADLIRRQVFPSEDELIAISEFVPSCAHHLIRGRNLAGQVEMALGMLPLQLDAGDRYRMEQMGTLGELLKLAEEQLGQATAILEQFVPVGRD